MQNFGSYDVQGFAESYVKAEMSWMEVDGAGRRWLAGLAMPIKKEISTQVFSCEFCEILKEHLFYRKPLMAASSENLSQPCSRKLKDNMLKRRNKYIVNSKWIKSINICGSRNTYFLENENIFQKTGVPFLN